MRAHPRKSSGVCHTSSFVCTAQDNAAPLRGKAGDMKSPLQTTFGERLNAALTKTEARARMNLASFDLTVPKWRNWQTR